ncbi:type II CRISPR-associated endonuclease Cas1 [Peptostreptococcus anaerobius]|uniref:type II CRISPR-associated endonuclease Cas1 n=1 Tax=Peptostreptococcus TaxID=1257 RepID=UPI00033D33C5|nr:MULTISPECIES: type II CRISPR-associated endonuclease Cas1 [Peptostreptococcus]MDB8821865.1 type II CRISPR-associated endonuclease Cas1 [Peptostreptococcus anaerobius]MDB8826533.1 type II CRISPR-associated endonuclease Cas1 [Peptostreptococcus anaerobius]MDB8828360.1 type II CRISPR-associated endonuclease Cas1 [Peptostreptococcus anaerobius]MDB8830161.1 type II CRISPR-associated endonuclease Cas1 [Peptostreptococcus anaerobius]MDB8832068.1 type II CRISPR-associated endonuclease Cas1 [Peptost
MSWRTVVIKSRSKLDYKMNYMVIRTVEDTKKVFLDEIHTLIVESTAVSITAALLNELTKSKVKIIFCDEKRNPSSELISYYGSHDTSAKYRNQISWNQSIKEEVWTEIVREKIKNQAKLLKELGHEECKMLEEYYNQVELFDTTNREGHAAKVYFKAIFGKNFSRSDEVPINSALNYGYAILLSTINREIVSMGYMTQFGLFHDNMFNQFNLSCDLMEPFRIYVDKKIIEMDIKEFTSIEKLNIIEAMNDMIEIDGQNMYFNNALKIYCRSVFDALNNNDVLDIKFWRYEL